MTLVFATHNPNKFKEAQALMPPGIKLLSLHDIGCTKEIPETGKTLTENALIKARFVARSYGYACFADDTGLLVDALNGAPGVYSARYAGEDGNAQRNMDKLLQTLGDREDRTARFITVISFISGNREFLFKGSVEGYITTVRKGNDGFGYDPIFQPEGYDVTFAELSRAEKNTISHRGKALKKLVTFLEENRKTNK